MQKIFNDSIISAVFQLLKILFRLIIGIYIVKHLDISDYGAYNLFILLISFSSVILSFNTHEYFNIAISSTKDINTKHNYFWTMTFMLLVFSLCFGLLFSIDFISSRVLTLLNLESYNTVYLYILFIIILTTISMTIVRYLAFSKYVVFFQIWTFFLQTIWFVPIYFFTFSVTNIFISQLIVLLPMIIIGLLYIRYKEKENSILNFKSIRIDFNFVKTSLKFGIGTYFALFGSFLLEITDKVMLSILSTNENVALYSFSNMPFSILQGFIVGTVFLIAMPYINEYNSSNSKKKFNLYHELINSFLYYLSGLLLIIILLSDEIILILGKSEYLQTSNVFPLFSIILMLTLTSSLLKHEAILNKSLKVLSLIYFIALLMNILLNFLLIPIYMFEGAILSTLFTSLLIVILLYKHTKIAFAKDVTLFKIIKLLSILLVIYTAYNAVGIYIKYWVSNNLIYVIIMALSLYFIFILLLYKTKLVPEHHKNFLSFLSNRL